MFTYYGLEYAKIFYSLSLAKQILIITIQITFIIVTFLLQIMKIVSHKFLYQIIKKEQKIKAKVFTLTFFLIIFFIK